MKFFLLLAECVGVNQQLGAYSGVHRLGYVQELLELKGSGCFRIMTLESRDISLRMDHHRRSGYRLGRIIARQQLLKKIAGGKRSDSANRQVSLLAADNRAFYTHVLLFSDLWNHKLQRQAWGRGYEWNAISWHVSKGSFVWQYLFILSQQMKARIVKGFVHQCQSMKARTTAGGKKSSETWPWVIM